MQVFKIKLQKERERKRHHSLNYKSKKKKKAFSSTLHPCKYMYPPKDIPKQVGKGYIYICSLSPPFLFSANLLAVHWVKSIFPLLSFFQASTEEIEKRGRRRRKKKAQLLASTLRAFSQDNINVVVQ